MIPKELQKAIGIKPDPLAGCVICGRDDEEIHACSRSNELQSMHLCPDCYIVVMIAGMKAVNRLVDLAAKEAA